ncbi:hypothetical protein G6F64_015184 [Rhizopus arrhizus]|uniref:Uncharacterized protein n=1 Tax=Rhizopus oryzae TaxID=64495 RepID=A0A9P7BHS9_RHIOR|nr:hypothetical protein G6F64_015184 [Rhizopus arrhizus]
MAQDPAEVLGFLRDLAALRARTAGHRQPAGLGPGVRRRSPEAGALQLFRAGREAVLHRTEGTGRPVLGDRAAVWPARAGRQRAGVA